MLFITRKEEPEFIDVLNNMKNINSLFRSEDITIVNADDYLQGGRYLIEPAHNLEIQFHEAIQNSGIPATFLCLYKSLPQELEGRFSECHDLIIKRAVTSTGLA